MSLTGPLNGVSPIDNEGVLNANGGILNLNNAVTGGGSACVSNGGALIFDAGFNQNVDFLGAGSLSLSQAAYGGTIQNFGTNDSIDLTNVAYDASSHPLLNALTNVLSFAENGQNYAFGFDSSVAGDYFHLSSDGALGTKIVVNHVA